MADPRISSPVISAKTVERAFRGLRSRGPDLLLRVALIGTFLALARTMLIPLLLGGLFAIVLWSFNQQVSLRLGKLGALAPALVTGVVVVGVLIPLSWLLWNAVTALNDFVASFLGQGAPQRQLVDALWGGLGLSPSETQMLSNAVNQLVRAVGGFVGELATGLARSLPSVVTSTFLFLLALYFGLRDGPNLIDWLRLVSPVTSERTQLLFDAVRRSATGTLLGMLVVAAVQGTLALAALLMFRVPHALLWAFIAAICSAIPIVGTAPVTIGSTVWLYLHDRHLAGLGMLISAFVISTSDNIVRPWVQAQHDDVHPLVALVAIFGGLAAFGPVGLLFGPVVASMAVWAVETYREAPEADALEELTLVARTSTIGASLRADAPTTLPAGTDASCVGDEPAASPSLRAGGEPADAAPSSARRRALSEGGEEGA